MLFLDCMNAIADQQLIRRHDREVLLDAWHRCDRWWTAAHGLSRRRSARLPTSLPALTPERMPPAGILFSVPDKSGIENRPDECVTCMHLGQIGSDLRKKGERNLLLGACARTLGLGSAAKRPVSCASVDRVGRGAQVIRPSRRPQAPLDLPTPRSSAISSHCQCWSLPPPMPSPPMPISADAGRCWCRSRWPPMPVAGDAGRVGRRCRRHRRRCRSLPMCRPLPMPGRSVEALSTRSGPAFVCRTERAGSRGETTCFVIHCETP